MSSEAKILSLEAIEIGYTAGKRKRILLPPLTGDAEDGELIAIIGRNGVGKSTLLRTLAGIQNPFSGRILYDGKAMKDYHRSEIALMAGYVSTESVKVSNMTVYDLVSLGRYPHTNWLGAIGREDSRIIDESLERTGVSAFRTRYVSELSDGERQKAMIARILAQDTPVMLMDEPTAFLDIGSKFEVLNLMHRLAHTDGKTIVFSTHDLHMAVNHADKIWLMLDSGLRQGSPEDLMLQGAFDHLFESSAVFFDSSKGTYSLREEKLGYVFIEGAEPYRHWTEEALRRTGFARSDVRTEPYIRISTEGQPRWEIISTEKILRFDSTYDLVRYLLKG